MANRPGRGAGVTPKPAGNATAGWSWITPRLAHSRMAAFGQRSLTLKALSCLRAA